VNVDMAASEEAHVAVHTEVATADRSHLGGPAESGPIDHALDATGTSSGYVQLNAADFTVFGVIHARHIRHTRARGIALPAAVATGK
jgi:hypothetical protein